MGNITLSTRLNVCIVYRKNSQIQVELVQMTCLTDRKCKRSLSTVCLRGAVIEMIIGYKTLEALLSKLSDYPKLLSTTHVELQICAEYITIPGRMPHPTQVETQGTRRGTVLVLCQTVSPQRR